MTTMNTRQQTSEMSGLRKAVEHLFDDYSPPPEMRDSWKSTFLVDVGETQDHVFVAAALPGVNPRDVAIALRGQSLTIKAHTMSRAVAGADYYAREIVDGGFYRVIPLPAPVIGRGANATFDNGLLTVQLTKTSEEPASPIKLNVAEPPLSRN